MIHNQPRNPACTILEQTHGRWWEVRGPGDELVCLTVHRKGARELVRRLVSGLATWS